MIKPIYLTFDDGPNPPYTEKILDTLERYAAKAVFFVCGKNAERHPELIKMIIEKGHALGNHSYSHSFRMTYRNDLYDEFKKNESILKKISGVDVKLIRAPWGLMLPSLKKKLIAEGYKVFRWDIAAYDWWNPSKEYISRKITSHAHSGSIVLLHDGEKTLENANRENTAEALELILKSLSQSGFSFEKLQ